MNIFLLKFKTFELLQKLQFMCEIVLKYLSNFVFSAPMEKLTKQEPRFQEEKELLQVIIGVSRSASGESFIFWNWNCKCNSDHEEGDEDLLG